MTEIKKQNFKWDMLYLGCGGECGIKGVSWDKQSKKWKARCWVNKKMHLIFIESFNNLWIDRLNKLDQQRNLNWKHWLKNLAAAYNRH